MTQKAAEKGKLEIIKHTKRQESNLKILMLYNCMTASALTN